MASPLRLFVDARVVAEDTRGIGRYARAVLRRIVERDDVELTLLAYGPFAFRHRGAFAGALGSSRFAIASHVDGRADVVWHPANGTFFPSHRPSVVTIHDAVPFRFADADPSRRAHAQEPFLRSAATAARVIAVSQFGSDELAEVFAIPRDRIAVIHHGVEPSFSPGEASPLPPQLRSGSYILFVGDPLAEPRKNFSLLYDAYRRAWPDLSRAPLLAVAGAHAPELEGVIWTGNLADDLRGATNQRLRALYRGALVLAMASFHETFGMPMIEAMACGTPVIASRASCLPEIGAGAALYAPPDDAAAWAEALATIAGDAALRDRLRIAGLDRAAHFSWEASADAHLEVFAEAARR